ncbi:MAG TPA: SWIM zinc finger family protein [Bryobacteraceae bacterium]
MGFYGFQPYVSVAQRRRNAASEMAKLKKKGHPVSPVVVEGRTIVKTFWGKAWCENLERYSDFENRLPRGRTYVRNGSVIDLQIAPGEIKALVSGSEIYKVKVKVAPVAKARWESICKDCAGAIESLIELLQGRLSKGVMERVCRQKTGLFPSPDEIQLSCSCPDWADMCKHVAAVLYGIGARLDQQPDLIFRLHNVDEKELIAGTGTALPQAKRAPAANKVLGGEDLSALFGLDIAQGTGVDGGLRRAEAGEPKRAEPTVETRTGKRVPAAPGGKGKVRAQGSAGKRRKQATAALGSRNLKKK